MEGFILKIQQFDVVDYEQIVIIFFQTKCICRIKSVFEADVEEMRIFVHCNRSMKFCKITI